MAEDTLRVSRIEIVDKDGETRAVLGSNSGTNDEDRHVGLTIYDGDQQCRLRAGVYGEEETPHLSLSDQEGNLRLLLKTTPEGDPNITLSGQENTPDVMVFVSSDHKGMIITDNPKQAQVGLTLGKDIQSPLTLSDTEGRPRVSLVLAESGEPKVNFLDEEGNITHTIPPRSPSKTFSGRTVPSTLESVSQIAAVIAIVAAVIYVLGLVALWAPIARVYTHDVFTAARAVSLIPNTQVAVQGVALIVGPALLYLLGIVAYQFATSLFSRANVRGIDFVLNRPFVERLRRFLPGWARGFLFDFVIICLLIALSAFLIIFPIYLTGLLTYVSAALNFLLRPFGVSYAYSIDDLSWWLELFSAVLAFLSLLPALEAALRVEIQKRPSSDARRIPLWRHLPKVHVDDWGEFLKQLLYAFVILAVAAGLAGATRNPPLSAVDVTMETGEPMHGNLLTYSDSTWYVFDSKNKLLGIPNEKVENVEHS